jgi:hypothetical protein
MQKELVYRTHYAERISVQNTLEIFNKHRAKLDCIEHLYKIGQQDIAEIKH